MSGLQRILKMYGRTSVSANGKTIIWVWDYANDCPCHETDILMGSERWKASERARWSPPTK